MKSLAKCDSVSDRKRMRSERNVETSIMALAAAGFPGLSAAEMLGGGGGVFSSGVLMFQLGASAPSIVTVLTLCRILFDDFRALAPGSLCPRV